VLPHENKVCLLEIVGWSSYLYYTFCWRFYFSYRGLSQLLAWRRSRYVLRILRNSKSKGNRISRISGVTSNSTNYTKSKAPFFLLPPPPLWLNVEEFIFATVVALRNWYVTQFSESFESASENNGVSFKLSQYCSPDVIAFIKCWLGFHTWVGLERSEKLWSVLMFFWYRAEEARVMIQ
jgi:hypothetical protein